MGKNATIGSTLARQRQSQSLSIECLSRIIEISPSTIERIECGEIENRYMEVVSIALVLNVDLPTLFGSELAPDEQQASRTFEIARSMSRLLAGQQ